MHCIVTGAAGFIGSRLVEGLNRRGITDVIAVDNLGHADKFRNLAGAEIADYVDQAEFIGNLERFEGSVAAVFHQGACSDTMETDGRYMMRNNYRYSVGLLEHCQDNDVPLLYASSASVYGLAEVFPTTERHHPYNNDTFYGAAKAFNEGMLRSFHRMYGLDYVALRYFNVYGPRMDAHGRYTEVLIRWMERIDAGQPPLILGDGTQTMDFVYVEDIARANILALASDVSDEVFNVASGVETSLNELAAALSRVMNVRPRAEYGPERKVNAVPRRLASTEKAERLLGFRAQVSLDDGLSRLVEWWRAERVRA